MASLKDIRAAIKSTLESNIADFTVYRTIPGSTSGIAAVVRPTTADFVVAMGKGTDTWALSLIVIVPASDLEVAQDQLDELIDGGGLRSIRRVIFANRTLGRDDTDAHVAGVTGYGPFEAAGYPNISASLSLPVHTKPTP